ncbi:MAG: hydrogenase maturation protease [Gammaproteobacteria bacterium]|nr:hydrogenase maturation protease [Gammaproteobacteria bacterium]
MKTMILGFGNTLLGDEGVGVHAVRALQTIGPVLDGVDLVDGGTLSFPLADLIGNTDNLIVIDAAELNSPPGTIHVYEGVEMDRFVNDSTKKSVHEVSLSDLLTVARLTDGIPTQRALIGVQPETIHWSDNLSTTIAGAIPGVCQSAQVLLQRWAA